MMMMMMMMMMMIPRLLWYRKMYTEVDLPVSAMDAPTAVS